MRSLREPSEDTAASASATSTCADAHRQPICPPWTKATQWFHGCLKIGVVQCSLHAAHHPKRYICAIPLLTLSLLAIGFFTNFELQLDLEAILSPTGSQPALNREWIFSEGGFPEETRDVAILFHQEGENVLTKEAMERAFLTVKTVQETEGYQELCQQGKYINFEGHKTCRFLSATSYFDDVNAFQQEVHDDQQLKDALSSTSFTNGAPVYHDAIIGNSIKDANGTFISAQSLLVSFYLPAVGKEADRFEEKMFQRLDKLRNNWIQQDQDKGKQVIYMDMFSIYAVQLEYQRAIYGDLYLVFVVALIMCSFVGTTFFAFGWGHQNANSRTLLGAASVFTISMSYLAGNGLMFLCGVPFSPLTQILPYVIFGVGLDDTFIITVAYLRTNPGLDVLQRIRITMEEVAHSISLTTITTIFAFLLGLWSSLPAVRWLCLYAFATIAIDFYFQVTLYIAFIVLDERRIQSGKRDICFWLPEKQKQQLEETVPTTAAADATTEENNEQAKPPAQEEQPNTAVTAESERSEEKIPMTEGKDTATAAAIEQPESIQSIQERIVGHFADFLLRPVVKGCVLLSFAALFAACVYSTTLLELEFKVVDFVPDDSFVKNVTFALTNYASIVTPVAVYFRDVDQTDPDMQQQMIKYVNDLEALDQISSIEVDATTQNGISAQVKPFCWVRDVQELAGAFEDIPGFDFVQNLTFIEKLDLALSNPIVRELYALDIIRDETGNITTSRCWLFFAGLDLDSVEEQLDLLHLQREVGAAQPINQGKEKGSWPFFFYQNVLFYWESYDVAIQELIATIRSGIIAMTIIAILMIPHWSAVFFVTPMIAMLYVNFLGSLQFLGLKINGVFYFCVLVSIGLLVDFLLHILLRYYETSTTKSRDERVKETLESMGTSILLGGLTTFLGVVPLCISRTALFMIVFKSFLAMVVLGLAHGLVLLPVLLSLVGPRSGLVSVSRKPSVIKGKEKRYDAPGGNTDDPAADFTEYHVIGHAPDTEKRGASEDSA